MSAYDVLPAGPPPGTAAPNAGKATATLVLAILSFFTCPITAIVALVVAGQASRQIRDSYGQLGGESLVSAGRIIAIANLGLSVVTVPILLAIAIPTFLGAQARAQDRAVQSQLRNTLTAEKVFFVDERRWTDDPATLAAIEPTLRYQQGTQPLAEDVVYVFVAGDAVELSARSDSGHCFYVISIGADGSTGYAEDDACGDASGQDFRTAWT
jgi:type II secretory pathway pseudopilin PulG